MTSTAASAGSRKAVRSSRKNRKTLAKVAASVALVAGAASVAGLGTFGAFTSTTSASEQVAAGRITLGQGASTQGPSIAAVGLVPGDTVERDVVLTRGATDEKFGSVKLTTTGASSNLLTTDTVNGLQLAIDQCSVAWTKVDATKSNGALKCAGTTTAVLASRPVVGANLDLAAATTALNTDAKVANLRVTLKFPEAAGNDFQGMGNTINMVFDATQRAAENR
ncbi:TasA family protein [Nocardioides sp. SOB77]|uniref:TasA family protein n=1 Tax=Nocardioides oceani TaxID=3058369 RepID=A0ABT8FEX5_9ACTN|nr:TasA family protein [Nocardioides oceani]MDN4173064.1 TasA family protein [Nocardioides oceani]MDN4174015.1 TasA family protein [Nocardioides oceani]